MRAIFIRAAIAAALFAVVAPVAKSQSPGEISVQVTGLRDDDGNVRCGLYNSPDTFHKPGLQFRGALGKISAGSATCRFEDVPPGTYAVALFHAEHNETKMEFGLFGQPKQDYGFSRNPDTTFGALDFPDASFVFAGGKQVVPVTVKY